MSTNKDSIAALMLENTFTSIPDIAKILFPLKIIKCLPGIAFATFTCYSFITFF